MQSVCAYLTQLWLKLFICITPAVHDGECKSNQLSYTSKTHAQGCDRMAVNAMFILNMYEPLSLSLSYYQKGFVKTCEIVPRL
jgi:hypothetical protein